MKHLNSVRFLSLSLAVAATLALPSVPAGAAQTDISQVPLGTASSTAVLPNLMFILDDSGSMGRQVMPDNVNDNNTCKSYRWESSGSTSTNCALDNGTDLVSPTEDNVRHVPTQPWFVGPPAFAAEFNTIYYNPLITYKPGKDRVGAVMPSFGSPWTAVKVNPYVSTNTFNLTTQYPEAVFCTASGSTATSATACRRNGYGSDATTQFTTLLTSFRYHNSATEPGDGSVGWPESTDGTGSGAFRYVRMRLGGPYYYTIQPREYCSDVNLSGVATSAGPQTCVLSSVPSGLNTIPAPVRYCQSSALASQNAVVTGLTGGTASCQAKLDAAHTFMRYGNFVRVDITPSVATYGGRPNRTDCAARPVCTYDEEMTNFANWYAYYHTRMQSMKTAGGLAFADMDDRYRIGFVTINASSSAKYLKIDKFEPVHKGNWYDKFYSQTPNSTTPLRLALSRVGRHYAGMTNGINSFMPDDPIQFSCQRNFALLTTDGYWNGPGGEKLDGTTDMDNQDNVTETFVSRPTVTLDGFGTTTVSSSTDRALEQVVCTGTAAGSANFTGTPDTTCGCSNNFKRVKQRTLDTFTSTTSVDGVAGTPTPGTSATFQDITACGATVFTRTWLVTEVELDRCTGSASTDFTNGSASNAGGETACGCGGTNRRIWQRTLTYNRTQQIVDGVGQPTVNGTILTQNFAAQTGCGTGSNPSQTPVITLGAPSDSAPSGSTITTASFTISPNPTFTTGITSTSATPGGFGNTLADVAMYYYKNDLRTTGPLSITKNDVKTTSKDTASHQHMVTFTLGLGLDGLMNYKDDYETATGGDFDAIRTGATGCSFSGAGTCNWPQPVADAPTALDDLWHAAVNGRGLYFSAKDPNAPQTGLTKALAAINAATGAAASSATSTPNLTPTDNLIYSSTYRTVNWDGEIIAERIDVVTGDVLPGNAWPGGSAGVQLNARTTASTDNRDIFTLDPTDGSRRLKEFRYGTLTGPEPEWFDNQCTDAPTVWPQCGPLSATDLTVANSGDNLVNWLRGQRQHETTYFRRRDNIMGDTVNSKPAYLGRPSLSYGDAVTPDYPSFKSGPAASRPPVLLISANDGMLHAFHGGTVNALGAVTDGGQELWAYVPRMLMPELYKLAATNYDTNHRYYVDGSPVTMDVFLGGAWKTILVGGLNAGGRGFYALDVTNPTPTGVKALWEICADPALCAISDPDMGYSYGQAVITKRPGDGKWVVIVSSGYNNVSPGDGGGYLYVLDAATGAILSKTGTTVAGTNVGDTTTPSGFAKIAGFSVNFSVNNTTPTVYGGDLLGNVWRFDLSANAATPSAVTAQRLGRAMDGTGAGAKPQSITTKPEITRFDAGFNVVYFATGRFIGASDIPDPASFTPALDLAYQQSVYAVKDTGTDLGILRSAGANLVQQTLIVIDSTSRTISNNSVTWSTQNGWYVDLNPASESPGERVNIDMQLVRGVLLVESNEPNNDACSSGGNSFFYQFDYKSGSYISSAPGGVVGILQGQALAAGFVVYRLPSGQMKYTGIDVTGKKTTGGVNPGSGGSLGRRVSWRELM